MTPQGARATHLCDCPGAFSSQDLLLNPHRFEQALLGTEQRIGVEVVVTQHSQNLLPFGRGQFKFPQKILPGIRFIKDGLVRIVPPSVVLIVVAANRVIAALLKMPLVSLDIWS